MHAHGEQERYCVKRNKAENSAQQGAKVTKTVLNEDVMHSRHVGISR